MCGHEVLSWGFIKDLPPAPLMGCQKAFITLGDWKCSHTRTLWALGRCPYCLPVSLQVNLALGSHIRLVPSQSFSSLASSQSLSPSHRQRSGMQVPSVTQWNSSALHSITDGSTETKGKKKSRTHTHRRIYCLTDQQLWGEDIWVPDRRKYVSQWVDTLIFFKKSSRSEAVMYNVPLLFFLLLAVLCVVCLSRVGGANRVWTVNVKHAVGLIPRLLGVQFIWSSTSYALVVSIYSLRQCAVLNSTPERNASASCPHVSKQKM